MTSRITVTVIDAVDPDPIAAFWREVLGWVERERDSEVISIGPADDPLTGIDVARVPEGKTIKNRLHFGLRPSGISQSDELERLLRLGARRIDVGQAPDVSWVVLADPEGNEFCLLERSIHDLCSGRSSDRQVEVDVSWVSGVVS